MDEPVKVTPDMIAAAPPDHDCAKHPKITHARWLECQFEIRDIHDGVPDPELDAIRRADQEARERMLRMYRDDFNRAAGETDAW